MARGYETHESFWANAKMYFQMLLRAIFLGALFQILIIGYSLHQVETDFSVVGTDTKMPGSVFVKYLTGQPGFLEDGFGA